MEARLGTLCSNISRRDTFLQEVKSWPSLSHWTYVYLDDSSMEQPKSTRGVKTTCVGRDVVPLATHIDVCHLGALRGFQLYNIQEWKRGRLYPHQYTNKKKNLQSVQGSYSLGHQLRLIELPSSCGYRRLGIGWSAVPPPTSKCVISCNTLPRTLRTFLYQLSRIVRSRLSSRSCRLATLSQSS